MSNLRSRRLVKSSPARGFDEGLDVAYAQDLLTARGMTVETQVGSSPPIGAHTSTASAGDVDGDGYAAYGGAVGLFYAPTSGTHAFDDADALWYGRTTEADAGTGLLGDTDLTGDGYPDLVIGAPGGTGGVAYSGVVFLVPGLAP
jgi:hypothetical protein